MKRENLSVAACVELLEVFVDEEDIYNIGLEHLDDILLSDYLNKEFTLVCNGFNPNKWQLKTCELDIVINESLSTQLMVLMVVSNIDYIRLTWGGADFVEFFPIDVFAKIESLQSDFSIAEILQEGDKLKSISSEISELSEALAYQYDSESYIDFALEYEDTVELIETIELQELILLELLSFSECDYDSVIMLYKDFIRNVYDLEMEHPMNPYLLSLGIMQLEIDEFTFNYIISVDPSFDKTDAEKLKLGDEITLYYVDPEINEVSELDIKNRFSEIVYDDDVLSYIVDDDDLGDIESVDWETVLNYEKFKKNKN